MNVEVRLFATLAKFLPAGSASDSAIVELPDPSTVDDLGAALAIPPEMPRIALVNGEDADGDLALRDGDVVALFPPLAGGV